MEEPSWLVTGGSGYIGSHVVARLCQAGRRVVVLNDYSVHLRERVPDEVPLIAASVTDEASVVRALREHHVSGVIHLAARKSAPESVADPLHYFAENVGGMGALLSAMGTAGVSKIVFASSAAVYGVPTTAEVREDSPTAPINPYGQSKLAGEWLLSAAGAAHGLDWLALRFFNVAGAASAGLADRGATNLIPLLFDAVRTGTPATVTGTDLPTRDGSGVRDYVHVEDLADAHLTALTHLESGGASGVYNVGTGAGYSVLEVIAAINKASGQEVPWVAGPARPGDPPEVVANVDAIARDLGWRAQRDLTDMIESAWHAQPAP